MLERYGWDRDWAAHFREHEASGLEPARVVVEHRGGYVVRAAGDDVAAEVAPKLRRSAGGPADFPAVGDWVALERRADRRARIHAVLPRRTAFSRRAATASSDRVEQQIVAANVDVVFIVTALDGDLNPRRLERYLALAHESGADPVVVLTKADAVPDAAALADDIANVAAGAPVHVVSNKTGAGLDALRAYFERDRTVAALGSSGVGKSTLVNALAGERLARTGEVSADGRGRHTTRARQLIEMPFGGLFLDTPGMRELRLWEADEGVDAAFPEIVELASDCRFGDCTHEVEPGCAVREALERGALERDRYESYLRLRAELDELERVQERKARAAKRR